MDSSKQNPEHTKRMQSVQSWGMTFISKIQHIMESTRNNRGKHSSVVLAKDSRIIKNSQLDSLLHHAISILFDQRTTMFLGGTKSMAENSVSVAKSIQEDIDKIKKLSWYKRILPKNRKELRNLLFQMKEIQGYDQGLKDCVDFFVGMVPKPEEKESL